MTDLMAGEIIAIIMLALAVAYLINRLVRETPDIVDCGMVHDCDGCDECGAPMVIEDATGVQLAEYGDRLIHRHCLDARRDGRTPCAECAPVMAGAR